MTILFNFGFLRCGMLDGFVLTSFCKLPWIVNRLFHFPQWPLPPLPLNHQQCRQQLIRLKIWQTTMCNLRQLKIPPVIHPMILLNFQNQSSFNIQVKLPKRHQPLHLKQSLFRSRESFNQIWKSIILQKEFSRFVESVFIKLISNIAGYHYWWCQCRQNMLEFQIL